MGRIRSRASKAAGVALIAVSATVSGCGDAAGPDGGGYAGRFDDLWRTFDQTYPYFEYKAIDWEAARTEFRPRAEAAGSQAELVAVVLEMLEPLRDLHVNLYRPRGAAIPTYAPAVERNWDRDTWLAYMADADWHTTGGSGWGWGRFGDVGYILIGDWSGEHVQPTDVDVALDSLRNTRSIIFDVRTNPGGNSSIAYAVAGRFSATPWIGGYVQYRTGPRHGDLGPLMSEPIQPRGAWQYLKPVYLLVGRGDASSSEGFISAMRELPNVRVLGDTTIGASGNPALYEMGEGWRYSVSRWIAYTGDGEVIEWNGIPPDEVVPWSEDDFARDYDPVLERALAEARGDGPVSPLSGDIAGRHRPRLPASSERRPDQQRVHVRLEP